MKFLSCIQLTIFLVLAVFLSACDSGADVTNNGDADDAGDMMMSDADDGGEDVAEDVEDGGEDVEDVEMDVSACETTCEGDTPVCDEESGECVECFTRSDCDGERFCDVEEADATNNACVECLANTDCDDPDVCAHDTDDRRDNLCVTCIEGDGCSDGTVCAVDQSDPENNICVGCLEDTDCDDGVCIEGDTPDQNTCEACREAANCTEAGAAACDTATNTCVACTEDSDCAGVSGAGICDEGVCVECTGTDYDACVGVCNSRQRTCTDMPPGDLGLCEECVSDAQCREGMLCVPMEFGEPSEEVGTFCLWKRDASVADAPDGACSRVAPYIDELTTESLDSGSALRVCSLNVTTCPALNDYQSSCPTPGETSTCGDPNLDDGLCVVFDAASNKCTVPCSGDDDCAGDTVSCNKAVTPFRCEL